MLRRSSDTSGQPTLRRHPRHQREIELNPSRIRSDPDSGIAVTHLTTPVMKRPVGTGWRSGWTPDEQPRSGLRRGSTGGWRLVTDAVVLPATRAFLIIQQATRPASPHRPEYLLSRLRVPATCLCHVARRSATA